MKNGGKRQKTSISARFWVRKHPKSGRNAQHRVVAYWIALDLLDSNNGHLTEVT